MRKIKCTILLSILCVASLLMSVLNVENTSARTISNVRGSLISQITFTTTSPSSNKSITLLNGSVTPLQEITTPGESETRFSRLNYILNSSLSASTGDRWRSRFIFQIVHAANVGVYAYTPFYTANCPSASGGKLVDTCTITQVDKDSVPTELRQAITTQNYTFDSASIEYYVVDLEGHFTRDSSGNAFDLSGTFLSIYNPIPSSISYNLQSYYSIFFDQFNIFTEVQDEDKAAEELNEMNQKDDQDRSDIESQSSNIDSSGESSQQSAENTGTTLLAAFSSFVTAITSASPSNCNIDMDLGNLDLGIVNFCTLSPPPEFQVLGSIFLILFCVPLSIATARKVISLFRSFQG